MKKLRLIHSNSFYTIIASSLEELNYEKNSLSYAKVVNIHLGFNLISMWYYTFFVYTWI